MLLYSPEFAAGWNTHAGYVRQKLSISPKLRELGMLVAVILSGAEFEIISHGPLFLAAGGTQEQLNALSDPDKALADERNLFDETERAALAVAIANTRTVHVPAAALQALLERIGPRHTVEFVGTVATYNMIARFLVPFGIDEGEPR
jgi:alkylhydroperoxidase family enzyme